MVKEDYSKLASIIIENVGGRENIAGLVHCITRLRFTLRNEGLAKDEVLRETDGIIDVIHAAGQYQVVIGNAVTKVFDAVTEELGDDLKENDQPVRQSETKNQFVQLSGNLIGFVTGAMSPVIGVIAASGITKGMLALLTLPQLASLLDAKGTTYATISAIADSAFYFLPILVGIGAARRLGGDVIVAAVIGGVLAYPTLVEWGRSFKGMFSIGALDFQFLNYSYSIFPMILAAWMARKLGDWLKDRLPDYLQMIFNPLITVFVVSVITLVVTGPVIQGLANGIAAFVNWAVSMSGWAGGFIIGGFYQVLVIFGLHWGVVPLVSQQIVSTGESPLNAIISDTMVAQGGAVLAVALKSRKEDTKALGIAAAVSAFCGVTEPAIYGINLRFRRVFIAGLTGSAAGGLVTGLMHGTMYGFTGGLIGFPSFFNPEDPGQLTSFCAFLLSSMVSIAVAFAMTWLWGYNDDMQMGEKIEKKKSPGASVAGA